MLLLNTSETNTTSPSLVDKYQFNILFGTSGNDVISLQEARQVYAGGGNDVVLGSTGRDTIDGGIGNDTLFGNDGDDRLSGASGNDVLYGESGNDRLYAGTGSDSMFGGAGNDRLYVDPNDDSNGFSTGAYDSANGGADIDTLVITNADAGSLRILGDEGATSQLVLWTETVGTDVIGQTIMVTDIEFVEMNGTKIALEAIPPF